MKLFDVYPLYDVTPVAAQGIEVTDDNGQKYLDFYGGHAVISIGHTHPHYVSSLKEQLDKIGFYSNSIQNPLQLKMAKKLGKLSGCNDYGLFLCNSGAEANENALNLGYNLRKEMDKIYPQVVKGSEPTQSQVDAAVEQAIKENNT